MPKTNDKLFIGSATIGLTVAALLFAFILGGCAAANLTGAAKVHQSVTLAIADGCTIAVQAEQLYQQGKIPQTDATRHAINDAGEACNQSKTAFTLALRAEQQYNDAQAQELVACTSAAAAQCTAATQSTKAQQVAADNANADLSSKLSTLTTKANAVKPLTAAH